VRIISGKYKGKKLIQPIDKETRPLKDLTKESIFNIIKHSNLLRANIENSNVLDIFSGVGSFGLECISRGASHVSFCENYERAISILERNISILKCKEKTTIINSNVFNKNIFSKISQKFEIIFLDPPFKEKNLFVIIENIIELNLLKKNGIFIIHRHKNKVESYPKNFKILLKKKYGVSQIIFGNNN
tara:strand:- start:869 stop:1432 length:564 start_codon:yes stop_codon:yes gene_type:complete